MENYEEKYKQALKRAKTILKLTDNPEEANGYVFTIFPELRESEDERIRKGIIRNLEYLAERAEGFVKDELKERIAWLEKQGGQKPAWSEEDEKMLLSIIEEIRPFGECPDYPTDEDREYYYGRTKMIDWLKFIKERVQPQPKQETKWSEEDDEMLQRIISDCEQKYVLLPNEVDWLKSLKPCWKPSEFQLECLKKVIPHNNTEKDCELEDVLTELYNDLKKL